MKSELVRRFLRGRGDGLVVEWQTSGRALCQWRRVAGTTLDDRADARDSIVLAMQCGFDILEIYP